MNVSSPVAPIETMKLKKNPESGMFNRGGSPVEFLESQSSVAYQTLKSSKINDEEKVSFSEIQKSKLYKKPANKEDEVKYVETEDGGISDIATPKVLTMVKSEFH